VDDSLPVCRIERAGDLDGMAQRLVRRQGYLRQALGQSLSFQELHHQVVDAVLVADIVKGADVRVGEARNSARLPFQPLSPSGVAKKRPRAGP